MTETWANEPGFTSTAGDGIPGMLLSATSRTCTSKPALTRVAHACFSFHTLLAITLKEKMLSALMNAVGKDDDEEESKFRVRLSRIGFKGWLHTAEIVLTHALLRETHCAARLTLVLCMHIVAFDGH